MLERSKLMTAISGGMADGLFEKLYGAKNVHTEQKRYLTVLERFGKIYPDRKEVELFSVPGRTEIGGNHTDHNLGRVLAGAVNLDMVAAAAQNGEDFIRVQSEGYPSDQITLQSLSAILEEKGTSAALVRGICARMRELGFQIGGFDVYIDGGVPKGSGLSSSAAFEVLIVTILNHLFNNGVVDPITAAKISQYAENDYFGKPCGLMDQTACAVGGVVTIDFKDPQNPEVKKVNFDFSQSGYSLVIVNTGGSHADLTDHYTAVKEEMQDVAKMFGGKVLRDVDPDKVWTKIPEIRTGVNSRAVLRAFHYFKDNERVLQEVAALERNDFSGFLQLVVASGYSSWMWLQNCYTPGDVKEQGIPMALALSELVLQGRGGWRVHGGGFAGTIQAFVPHDLLQEYLEKMRMVFGPDACYELIIRNIGATKVEIQ